MRASEVKWFIEMLKDLEDANQSGRGEDGRWYPIDVRGDMTVGYGRLIDTPYATIDGKEVDLSGGLTDDQVDKLLRIDIDRKEQAAMREWAKLGGSKKPWAKLSLLERLMLTEVRFNTSTKLEGFPKMVKAIQKGDTEAAIKEFSERKDLPRREKILLSTFTKQYKSAPSAPKSSSPETPTTAAGREDMVFFGDFIKPFEGLITDKKKQAQMYINYVNLQFERRKASQLPELHPEDIKAARKQQIEIEEEELKAAEAELQAEADKVLAPKEETKRPEPVKASKSDSINTIPFKLSPGVYEQDGKFFEIQEQIDELF